MQVLVTGANGFLGKPLIRYLQDSGHQVVAASRHNPYAENVVWRRIGDLSMPFNWLPILDGVDAVVHLAGIAHVSSDMESLRSVNVNATQSLLIAAQHRGIKRFVFVSSILAQTGTTSSHVLTESDRPSPTSEYGKSKLLAENEVKQSNLNFTILRPVIIEGENAKGNVKMLRAIATLPLPLPFQSITARRSTLSIVNFCSAVRHTLETTETIGKTYIVADRQARSIGQMVSDIRVKRGRRPLLFSVSETTLGKIASAFGKADVWEKIASPLVVDPSALIQTGWIPE